MELTVGAVAYDPKVVTIWELIRDVTAEAPARIDYVLYSTYEALVDALLAGAVDLAWNTNTAFVRTYLRAQGKCWGLVMRDTDCGYTSKLIAPVDSGIARLEDLRGKRVAFGSRDSGHAAILPAYYLRQAGLEAGRDYSAVKFDLDVGKHGDTGTSEGAVLDAVRQGTADAGFVGDPFWLRALATGSVDGRRLEAVWTSPSYSHCTFTALPTLSESAARAFMETFVNMDPADSRVRRMMELEGLKAWVPTDVAGYHDLIAAMSVATGGQQG